MNSLLVIIDEEKDLGDISNRSGDSIHATFMPHSLLGRALIFEYWSSSEELTATPDL